jgi:NADH:ubiquinone oxidoreductase subunit 6 (subunit J)
VGAELPHGEAIIATMGEMFVTTYLIPFQMMALLLLVALAGALMLARDK